MTARGELPASVTAKAAASAAEVAARWRGSSHAPAHLAFWVSTLLVAVTAMARNSYLFTVPMHEAGDEAVNSLLVIRAEHFDQLVGNYSRVGFHHPGPALFYVLAAGQAFFHGLLHVAPAPFNGEQLGAIAFTSVLIGLTVLAIYRSTRSLAAGAIALSGLFLFAAHRVPFGDVWFPYLYMGPFLLFVVAGAALAAGHTVELPSFVLAAGLLVHGHVAFLVFVVVTTVGVVACWLLRYRRGWRAELAGHRWGGIGSAVLLVAFLLPLVLEVVLHYPGPWRGYWHYLGHHNPPRSVGDVLRFTGWYWSYLPLAVIVAAPVAAAALMVRERNRIFGYLYGMLALQSLVFLFYVARGVDVLDATNRYVGLFYLTVPVLLVVTAAAQLGDRVAGLVSAASRPLKLGVPLAIGAAGMAVAGFAAATPQPVLPYLHGTDYRRLAAALAAAPARRGRAVAIHFTTATWPQAAGIGIAAQRQHLPWCVSSVWRNVFTASYVCRAGEAQWGVSVRSAPVSGRADVVWRDRHLAVVERPPHAGLLGTIR